MWSSLHSYIFEFSIALGKSLVQSRGCTGVDKRKSSQGSRGVFLESEDRQAAKPLAKGWNWEMEAPRTRRIFSFSTSFSAASCVSISVCRLIILVLDRLLEGGQFSASIIQKLEQSRLSLISRTSFWVTHLPSGSINWVALKLEEWEPGYRHTNMATSRFRDLHLGTLPKKEVADTYVR